MGIYFLYGGPISIGEGIRIGEGFDPKMLTRFLVVSLIFLVILLEDL